MISHGKDLKIFSGNSNRALAEAICKELRLPLGDLECGHFSDGECFVSIYETVRGSDVFVIQSGRPSPATPSPPSWWPTCSPPPAPTVC